MKFLVVAFCTALFVYALASVWTDIVQPQVASRNLAKPAPRTLSSSAKKPSKQSVRRPSEFIELDDDQKEAPAVAPAIAKRPSSRIKPPVVEVPSEADADELARQIEDVRRREAELLARKESLRLIYDDIYKELELSRQVHQRANDTLMAAQERATIVAQVGPDSVGNRRINEERIASARSGDPVAMRAPTEVTSQAPTEVDGVGGMALIVRQLASQGNETAATSFLRRMKEREAAKVLAIVAKDEPRLATRLVGALQVARNQVDRN